ncbi:MAG TPA: GIY-YIG nuclease family protein [Gemmatimonadaceae bacterium]|nr:GIY-YIG nuclease family protein [Gemmatimonadaceae bacterium]
MSSDNAGTACTPTRLSFRAERARSARGGEESRCPGCHSERSRGGGGGEESRSSWLSFRAEPRQRRRRGIAIVPIEGFRHEQQYRDAGLRTTRCKRSPMRRLYYVYMLSNRSRTLYVGVTNDVVRRVAQHRAGLGSRFAKRYAIHRLVFVESTTSVRDAIAREKQIKRWSRAKRIALIEEHNPEWTDLAAGWSITLDRDDCDSSPPPLTRLRSE